MVGHGGSSAGSYLADPTSPIPSHCASIVATSTVRVKNPRVAVIRQCDSVLEFVKIRLGHYLGSELVLFNS